MKEALLSIMLGYELPVANHPLFGERWEKYANAYNGFVEELGLSDEQIKGLRELLDCTKAIERLGYLTAYKIGVTSTNVDARYMEVSEEFLGFNKEEQANIANFVRKLMEEK